MQDNRSQIGIRDKKASRNSLIELMKIVALFMIVIHHVGQTLSGIGIEDCPYDFSRWVLDISTATRNAQQFIITFFEIFSPIGNDLFFVCSAWFLCSMPQNNKKKILNLICNIWTVSVLILLCFKILKFPVSSKLVFKSFLPTTFANNWYMTCYIMFYLLFPILNHIIGNIDKKKHLSILLALFFFCFIVDSFFYGKYYINDLTIWIAIYFLVAYIKLYRGDLVNNKTIILKYLIASLGMILCIDIFLNTMGLKLSFLNGGMLHFDNNSNPFALAVALSLFLLALQNKKLHSKIINYVASCSLYIYIIHENILVRTYLRPLIWMRVKEIFGYSYVLVWDLVISIIVFLIAVFFSIVYKLTIQKIILKWCDSIFPLLSKVWNNLLNKMIAVHGVDQDTHK